MLRHNFQYIWRVLQIQKSILDETIALCKFHFSKKFISKNKLQVVIGHLMFLHKAIKPVRVFVNRILALLRKMGAGAKAAIDEGTKQDYKPPMVYSLRPCG
jgi:hypothetical protein